MAPAKRGRPLSQDTDDAAILLKRQQTKERVRRFRERQRLQQVDRQQLSQQQKDQSQQVFSTYLHTIPIEPTPTSIGLRLSGLNIAIDSNATAEQANLTENRDSHQQLYLDQQDQTQDWVKTVPTPDLIPTTETPVREEHQSPDARHQTIKPPITTPPQQPLLPSPHQPQQQTNRAPPHQLTIEPSQTPASKSSRQSSISNFFHIQRQLPQPATASNLPKGKLVVTPPQRPPTSQQTTNAITISSDRSSSISSTSLVSNSRSIRSRTSDKSRTSRASHRSRASRTSLNPRTSTHVPTSNPISPANSIFQYLTPSSTKIQQSTRGLAINAALHENDGPSHTPSRHTDYDTFVRPPRGSTEELYYLTPERYRLGPNALGNMPRSIEEHFSDNLHIGDDYEPNGDGLGEIANTGNISDSNQTVQIEGNSGGSDRRNSVSSNYEDRDERENYNDDDDSDGDSNISIGSESEWVEITEQDFAAEKLLDQLLEGFHGCSETDHAEALNGHNEKVGTRPHRKLTDINRVQTFPDVISHSKLLTTDQLDNLEPTTAGQWAETFCGTRFQRIRHGPASYPAHVCLHAEETRLAEAWVAYDIDSFIGFASSLAVARQGISWQAVPQPRQNIATDVHIKADIHRVLEEDEENLNAFEEATTQSKPLKDIPHFHLGTVVGASEIAVYILFPWLDPDPPRENEQDADRPRPPKKFTALKREQLTQWYNEVFYPSIHKHITSHYTQHLPPSYRQAEADSRARQTEKRSVSTQSYQAQQSITYHIQPEYLADIWSRIGEILHERHDLHKFFEPQICLMAKGTKLQFKSNPSRPHLAGCLTNFQLYLERVLDILYLDQDRLCIDIGKEICPTPSFLSHQNPGLNDEPQVYFWKRCCLEKYSSWFYDTEDDDSPKGRQSFYHNSMLNDAVNLTTETPVRSLLRRGGIIYSQFYTSVKEIFDASKTFPLASDRQEELALDKTIRTIARHIVRNRMGDAAVVEHAYCTGKKRFKQAIDDGWKKSFGVREEHRVTWPMAKHMLQLLEGRNSESEDMKVLPDAPSYIWPIQTSSYFTYLTRHVNKFAAGFEFVRARSNPEIVTWEDTKIMVMFLRCLRFSIGAYDFSREGALWWGRREGIIPDPPPDINHPHGRHRRQRIHYTRGGPSGQRRTIRGGRQRGNHHASSSNNRAGPSTQRGGTRGRHQRGNHHASSSNIQHQNNEDRGGDEDDPDPNDPDDDHQIDGEEGDLPAGRSRTWIGLGFSRTMKEYGYAWIEPRIDWRDLRFRENITDHMMFGNRILQRQYLRRGGQLSDFFNLRHQVDVALKWLPTYQNNLDIRYTLIEWLVHLTLRQYRRDVTAAIKKDLQVEKRPEMQEALKPWSYEYIMDVTIDQPSLVSGNQTRTKEPEDLFEYLFGPPGNPRFSRHNWADIPYRLLYESIIRSLTNIAPADHAHADLYVELLRQFLFLYHWILPLPNPMGLTQKNKESQRMWYSVNTLTDLSRPVEEYQPFDELLTMARINAGPRWMWAMKNWREGNPEPLPAYLRWTKDDWQAYIEEHEQGEDVDDEGDSDEARDGSDD